MHSNQHFLLYLTVLFSSPDSDLTSDYFSRYLFLNIGPLICSDFAVSELISAKYLLIIEILEACFWLTEQPKKSGIYSRSIVRDLPPLNHLNWITSGQRMKERTLMVATLFNPTAP